MCVKLDMANNRKNKNPVPNIRIARESRMRSFGIFKISSAKQIYSLSSSNKTEPKGNG